MRKRGMGSHTRPNQGGTDTWLTPPGLLARLGRFDLDPCAAPTPRPWPTADRHIELPEDGLAAPWSRSVCPRCPPPLVPSLPPEDGGGLETCPLCGLPMEVRRDRVWLNPPYGKEADRWLRKMARHRSGLALVFARTETATWAEAVWPEAHSILFLEGRLFFHYPDGSRGESNSGGPSALLSYSEADTRALADSGLRGALAAAWRRLQ